mmetsp:Transcript_38081/g.38461  ORF Transcript_38081/g.38461 Transcript_38081/m.38461 type:complete len:94 (+) Transcript_38081:157-438(+)
MKYWRNQNAFKLFITCMGCSTDRKKSSSSCDCIESFIVERAIYPKPIGVCLASSVVSSITVSKFLIHLHYEWEYHLLYILRICFRTAQPGKSW